MLVTEPQSGKGGASPGRPVVRLGSRQRNACAVSLGQGQPALGLLVGLSPGGTTLDAEVAKSQAAISHDISTITDLTTSCDDRLLGALLEMPAAIGTVPAYTIAPARRNGDRSVPNTLLAAIERQVLQGVDFLSIHASLTQDIVAALPAASRVIPISSRGGAIVLEVMSSQGSENPFRVIFDELLRMCAQYRVVLSFVGSLRPASVGDAFEPLHLAELSEISSLCEQAHEAGVQTIVELVNHVSLNEIPLYLRLGRRLFPHAALGALGPTPTDTAVGLDDVAGAIGAAIATQAGIDWINIVTAGEHSHLPTPEETTRALHYFQLAVHIAQLAQGDVDQDIALSRARAINDWAAMARQASCPSLAEGLYAEHHLHQGAACSMCRATCPLVRYKRLSKAAAQDATER